MSHPIFVHNKSGHDQTFEVHGWNNNQSMTVHAKSTLTINAPDGSSGAIIALHDGHEGEQAEITKKGFGGELEPGNDFIDLSNIVGAGGNMTVKQKGDDSTLKGDPNFMQDLNRAWHKASQQTKNGLSKCVHLDGAGNVLRIDAIKEYPTLEAFVRSFANGMTYIGNGSWAGNPGNPNDNKRSSAAHGNKDILVTYDNGNAQPGDNGPLVPGSGGSATYKIAAGDTFWSISQHFGLTVGQVISLVPRQNGHALFMSFAAESTSANAAANGPGILLTNKSAKACTYYFYDNYWNGNGTAGANFNHPLKHVALAAHATHFVPLPTTFKGRVQRGTLIPATWAEFQISASNDHAAHGDVSVEQGNDGGAWIRAMDGKKSAAGFTGDVLSWGPPEAYQTRADGVRALASTMGNWLGGPNEAAIKCQIARIGATVYVVGGTGVPDVASGIGRLAVEFY